MPRATANFIPRFRTIADELIDSIKKGEYSNGQLLPSERELGLQYNLSRQTIRNALNILASEGWIVSQAGKGSSVQFPPASGAPLPAPRIRTPSKQIGLIYRSSLLQTDVGIAQQLLGLKSAISGEGYSLALSVGSKDKKRRLYPIFPRWIKEDQVDGYILASVPAHVQKTFAEFNRPVVNLGYLWQDVDIPSVALNFRAIYRKAIHYLAERQLLPLCNVVIGDESIEDARFAGELIAGHRDGQHDLQLSAKQARLIRYKNSAYELVASIRRALKKSPAPRAIILQSGDHIDEVLQSFALSGIRIPQDLFILVMQFYSPPSLYYGRVARFEHDVVGLAKKAGEKLLEIFETGNAVSRHDLHSAGQFVDPLQGIAAVIP